MKKILRIVIILFITALVVIQFFQPEKNQGEMTGDHLFEVTDVPEDIKTLLKTSCLDCHSNQTKYRWYNHIAPASWLVNSHVVNGKEELNLSEWGNMDVLDKISALDKMCEEVEDGEMPLKSYKLMYPGARLSEEQKALLCEWTGKLSEELLTEMEE
ncbi:heme-binding domain-containing protein [Mariniphaga sediminis]|uniref:heme-binding domain-containing protein n=1 Tax=Mariniphaga sediminis TaxID=1628158 RepID=UPI00356A8D50